MNVSLTPQLETMIRQRVESGRYQNASEVVREALRLLEANERVEHLRAVLAVGLEQERRGELVSFTPEREEEIDRRAEERFQRGELPNPKVCPSTRRSTHPRSGPRLRGYFALHPTYLGQGTENDLSVQRSRSSSDRSIAPFLI